MEETLQKLREKRKQLCDKISYIQSSNSYSSYVNDGMEAGKSEIDDNFISSSISNSLEELQNDLYRVDKQILETEIEYYSSQGQYEIAESKQQEYDRLYNVKKM